MTKLAMEFLPGASAPTQGKVTVTAVSTTLLPAKRRAYLLLQNNSGSDIFIRLDGGTAVADATSFKVVSGGSLELTTYLSSLAVTGIVSAGTEDLTYLEA